MYIVCVCVGDQEPFLYYVWTAGTQPQSRWIWEHSVWADISIVRQLPSCSPSYVQQLLRSASPTAVHTSVTGTACITSPVLYSSADWSQTIKSWKQYSSVNYTYCTNCVLCSLTYWASYWFTDDLIYISKF
jgi:hypothetical protein